MPDITLCTTEHCPAATQCMRKLATPNEHRQSYSSFEFELMPNDTIKCEHFIRGAL